MQEGGSQQTAFHPTSKQLGSASHMSYAPRPALHEYPPLHHAAPRPTGTRPPHRGPSPSGCQLPQCAVPLGCPWSHGLPCTMPLPGARARSGSWRMPWTRISDEGAWKPWLLQPGGRAQADPLEVACGLQATSWAALACPMETQIASVQDSPVLTTRRGIYAAPPQSLPSI